KLALVLPLRVAARGPGCREIYFWAGRLGRSLYYDDGRVVVLPLLRARIPGERGLFVRRARVETVPDLRRHHDPGVRRIRRRVYGDWAFLPQPDHPGSACLRLGVGQLPSAAAAEKDQHNSFPPFALAYTCERRAAGDGRRPAPGLDFGPEHAHFHRRSIDPCQRAHSQDGDQIRRRIESARAVIRSVYTTAENGWDCTGLIDAELSK